MLGYELYSSFIYIVWICVLGHFLFCLCSVMFVDRFIRCMKETFLDCICLFLLLVLLLLLLLIV